MHESSTTPQPLTSWLHQQLQRPERGLGVILLLVVILHLPFINLPPRGMHVWRQCATLMVARNFHEEGMDILRPRVYNRGLTDGATGANFPSYEFALAGLYRVFGGEADWIPRVWSLAWYLLGVLGLYAFARAFFSNVLEEARRNLLALTAAAAFAFSPSIFYDGLNAMPDTLALPATLWGLFGFLRWRASGYGHWGWWTLAFGGILLGGLTKLPFLMVGVAVGVWVLWDWRIWRGQAQTWCKLLVFGLLAPGLPLLWYRFAARRIEETGHYDFGIWLQEPPTWAEFVRITWANLHSDLPEYLLGFSAFALCVLGLVWLARSWRSGPREHVWAVAAWAVLFALYYWIETYQMEHHEYYLWPGLPILWLVVALGADWLWARRWSMALLLLWVAMPVLASIRIMPGWLGTRTQVPIELYDPEMRAQLRAAVPDSTLTITGPDRSNLIFFHFLHKRGYCFQHPDSLTTQNTPSGLPWLADVVQQGASILYTHEALPDCLRPLVQDTIQQTGAFIVYRLYIPQNFAASCNTF